MFFGKAAERQNMRVPRWCFAHEGSDHENYHVHCLSPLELYQYFLAKGVRKHGTEALF
jgi:hypothetical protein